MERIEIITSTSDLEGTCYIELSPGKYEGKHWQDKNIFFDEEVFGLIEPVFERNLVNYSHYDINEANADSWKKVKIDLKLLEERLITANDFSDIIGSVGFIFSDTRDSFQNNFQSCRAQLCTMIQNLTEWIELNIKKYGCIAVLGL